MRRLAHQGKPTVAVEGDVVAGLLEVPAFQLAHRHAVSAGALDVAAADAQSKLAGSQPVRRLPPIARNRDVHLAHQTLDKIGTEIRTVIDRRQTRKSGTGSLEHGDFPLPLRRQEIPVRASQRYLKFF